MALPGNPRHFARNIAEGYAPFTRATIRQYTPVELKTIVRNLELVVRDYRGQTIPLDDIKALQQRNQVLQRANTALLLIRSYAKRRRINL